jgi:hypothetical protein
MPTSSNPMIAESYSDFLDSTRASRRPGFARIWHEFDQGNLTVLRRDVCLVFEAIAAQEESAPSHDVIAEHLACSARTVGRALAKGAALGLFPEGDKR